MKEKIYDLLKYINDNNSIPSADKLGISDEKLIGLIKKCLNDGFLDKKYIIINILGKIECSDDVEFALTQKALDFLDNNDYFNKVIG